jgi:hypothetical protein
MLSAAAIKQRKQRAKQKAERAADAAAEEAAKKAEEEQAAAEAEKKQKQKANKKVYDDNYYRNIRQNKKAPKNPTMTDTPSKETPGKVTAASTDETMAVIPSAAFHRQAMVTLPGFNISGAGFNLSGAESALYRRDILAHQQNEVARERIAADARRLAAEAAARQRQMDIEEARLAADRERVAAENQRQQERAEADREDKNRLWDMLGIKNAKVEQQNAVINDLTAKNARAEGERDATARANVTLKETLGGTLTNIERIMTPSKRPANDNMASAKIKCPNLPDLPEDEEEEEEDRKPAARTYNKGEEKADAKPAARSTGSGSETGYVEAASMPPSQATAVASAPTGCGWAIGSKAQFPGARLFEETNVDCKFDVS